MVVSINEKVTGVETAGVTSAVEPIIERDDVVDTPVLAYEAMSIKWEVLDDLMGGTLRMRAVREKWLPREPAEGTSAYNIRLTRSVLFNAFKSTVIRIQSKPFIRPVELNGDPLPERLQDIEKDADGSGHNLTQFAKEVLKDAVIKGKTHILIDHPKMQPDATIADEKSVNARPVFKHVKADQLIGWDVEEIPGQGEQLKEIRIMEERTVKEGRWLDRVVRFIRVFTETTWELWREEEVEATQIKDGNTELKKTKFVKKESGDHTFGAVPLVTLYTNRIGPLIADPPLEDLAWENVGHWQSSSDQKNILRFARFGLLFGKGFSRETLDKGIQIGPSRTILEEDVDADLKYVEHNGKAIEAGAKDVRSIEERMSMLGLLPLVTRSGNITATGKAIDEGNAQNDVQAWIRNLENALRQAYEAAAKWLSLKIPENFAVDVFNNFGLGLRAMEDSELLLESVEKRALTKKTYLKEIKRRGILSDTLDVDDEIEGIQAEDAAALENMLGTGEDVGAGEFQTGITNEHQHAVGPGDQITGSANGHTHPVNPDGTIGTAGDDLHTHSVSDEQKQLLADE